MRRIALCSSSEVNSGLFLSARLLPEIKSSQDELFMFVYQGDVAVYMSHVSCGCFEFEKRDRLMAVIALEIMS